MPKYLKQSLMVVVVTVLVALIISLFQFLAHELAAFSDYLVNLNTLSLVLTIILTTLYSIGVIYINKKIPGYTGSGIPQFEAYFNQDFSFSPLKMAVLIFSNSMLAFFAGLMLGGEGPSISISGSLAMLTNKTFKEEDKELVMAANSAGFACAFLSPFAGLMHLLEENKKHLSISLIIKGLFIIIVSSIITYFIYNHDLLPLKSELVLPYKYYYIIPVIIVMSLVISKLYIIFITFFKDFSKKSKILGYMLPILIISFLLIKRYYPLIGGSGANLFKLDVLDYSLFIILAFLIVRLLGTALSSNTLISGGLVLPMLAVGSLEGYIITSLFSKVNGIIDYQNTIVIISMLSCYAVICKTPLTAMALGLKMAPLKVYLLPLTIVLIPTTIIIHLLKWDNIYGELEKRLPGLERSDLDARNI